MNPHPLQIVDHAFASAAAPHEHRIEVTHEPFSASRKAATNLLKSVGDADLPDTEVRQLRYCVLPTINLFYLPIDWGHDQAYGPQYRQNMHAAKVIARRRSHAVNDALAAYEDAVDRLLAPSENQEGHPRNPIAKWAMELLRSVLANSEGTVCVPVRGGHKAAWAGLLGALDSPDVSRVVCCVPSVLRTHCPSAVFTIGPIHPWNYGRFGWPNFIRSAPVAPLLANVRWRGDVDRPVEGFYLDDTMKWCRHVEVKDDFAEFRDDRLSWDRIAFEELYAPGRNTAGSPSWASGGTSSGASKVRVVTGDQKRREIDLAEGREESRIMVATLAGRRPGPVRTMRQHLDSHTRQDAGALLMVVLDDDERRAAHQAQRKRAPSDLRREQSTWKTTLSRRLDSDRDSLLDELSRASGGDPTLCSLQNLRNWADTSTGATLGPADKDRFRLLLRVLHLEEHCDRYWAVIEMYRLMGRRLGFQLSAEIASAVEQRVRHIDEQEWEELDAGNEVELHLDGLDVALTAQRIEKIESFSERSEPDGVDAPSIF